MAFTPEQEKAIQTEGKVIVSASAGSGKTTVMIEKIIRLITSERAGVDEILAVTFTKKAAAQMKEKLCKALIEEINGAGTSPEKRALLKKQLALVPNADISTIHGYCSKLIKRNFFMAGVDGGFKVIGGDDAEGRALKNAALDELLEEGYEAQDEDFSRLLSSYWRKKKDDALRKIFLTTYDGLRDRADYIEYLEKNQAGYTEETFQSVADDLIALFHEKCEYYRDLVEVEEGYFRGLSEKADNQIGLCVGLVEWLNAYLGTSNYFDMPQIEKPKLPQNRGSKTDSEEKKGAMARLGFLRTRIIKTVENEFSDLKSEAEELEYFLRSGRTASALAKYLRRFDEKYTARKTARGVLDYNDLEHKALALLQIPEIAEDTRKKYRYVFVDEFQDVNDVQKSLVSRFAGENLFLVGDVKQAIYGFRGSKSEIFTQAKNDYQKGEGNALVLSRNFRSMDQILDAVNANFSKVIPNYERMERGGRYALNSGKVTVHILPEGEKGEPSPRGVYSVKENARPKAQDAGDFAKQIAQIIEEECKSTILDGKTGKERRVEYADIAVLTRKKGGDIVEEVEALTTLGVPVTTASAVNVCDFTEVKALIDILSLIDNGAQDIPLCSALLSGMGNLSVDDLAQIRLVYKTASTFRAACKRYAREQSDEISEKLNGFYAYLEKIRIEACVLTAGEVLAKLLADTQMEAGLLARKDGTACLKRIRRFLEEASSFDGESVHDFLEYLRNLDYKIEYSENGGENSVKVMTMHSSKGLEFPIVILPNLSVAFYGGETPEVYVEEKYGLAPRAFDSENMLRRGTLLRRLSKRKAERSSLADEVNLYYVACTRAEQRLHLLFEERNAVPDIRYATSFAELTDFSEWEDYIVEDTLFDVRKQERQTLLQKADEAQVREIITAYSWQYTHAGYENLPVKSSPTQLLPEGQVLQKNRFQDFGKEETEVERGLSVQEGTAYHGFLERFDFSLLVDDRGKPIGKEVIASLVEETLEGLVGSEVDVALLEKEKLVEILQNPVFYRLQGARLYKEKQFTVLLPVRETYAKKYPEFLLDEEEEMLFQGAIDLLAVSEDGVQIIDYKYSVRSAEELKEHYRAQLDLYKLATSKIMKIPTEKIRCGIVNIRRGFQVDMD